MYISVVLNNEYMLTKERNKWFLKALAKAKYDDCLIITHECLGKDIEGLIDNCDDRFYNEFEMEKVTPEDVRKMSICYIPDSFFDDLYSASNSRTKTILNLSNNRFEELENLIIRFIDKELKKRNISKPDYILNCLHTFESIRYIANYYECPIIPYVFSSIRKVHGYAETLYMAHMDNDLFNSGAAKAMYDNFDADIVPFKLFNRREILSLIGKKHNLCLMPMLEKQGKYEIGVIGEGFHIIPQTYQMELTTDDDLYYESELLFGKENITSRLHPMQLDQSGMGRRHMKNDPAAFVLSAKRLATVQSQMIIKAVMWNRAACRVGDSTPYSFLFSRDFKELDPIKEEDLNFIIFAYFIPNSCMFSEEYWLWRLTNPSVNDILNRHIKEIFADLGLEESVLYKDNRIIQILKNRGCSDNEIKRYLKTDVDTTDIQYNYISSRAISTCDGEKVRDIFVLNDFDGNDIISTFEIEDKDADNLNLYLTNDIDGFVTIKRITVGDKEIEVDSSEKYWSKNATNASVKLPKSETQVSVVWSVKSYADAFND